MADDKGTTNNVTESQRQNYYYCMLSNIPDSFRTTDLRNYFSEYIEKRKFDMFHYRHRPQIINVVDKDKACGSAPSNYPSGSRDCAENNSIKRCCCVIRFLPDLGRNSFIERYHMKYWMDKDGNDLPFKCVIIKVNLNNEDLQKFANKELHPPQFMPMGNIGTPNEHFLTLIRQCRLPPSLIKKLGLEFPRARVFKRYSKVPMNYGTRVVKGSTNEEDEIKTGKGHCISDVYVSEQLGSATPSTSSNNDAVEKDSDTESHADDDEDRCEEWERHEALHDHRTTHGDVTSESKERLYESEIELKWEKGGPGLVWYTDAQFWDEQRGSFDEKTADDWDVDMQGYYEQGAGDKDAHDLMDIRRSERIRQGLETISVVKQDANKRSSYKAKIKLGNKDQTSNIGEFEKHTRGIGRKVMQKFGWKDGDGLGKTIIGMSEALDGEGQGPADKRGFGYYGEKLDLGNPIKRRREFKDYDLEAEDRIVIGTVYDKPQDLDVSEPLNRRNAPTFVKRYEFPQKSDASHSQTK